jgi:glycosyltransferase involved in cell wall biosynthesis
MLRMIFVTPSLAPAGAERHAVTLMNRLAERGHECHALYVKDWQPSEIGRVRLGSGTVRCLDAAGYLDMRAVRDLAAQLSRIKPSLVVAANPYALMYARLALQRSGVCARLVVTFHTMLLQSAKEWLQMLCHRPFFWAADASIFVCENQRRYWLRRGVFSRRNEVIHNGVDTDEFCDRCSLEERATLRGALGFSDGDYVIGIPAWLRPEKNHVQLIDALAALRKMGIRARGLMVGEGEMRGAIEARARALKVENDVVITGFQQDVRPYVGASDVVVLCSLTETFSLAAIEAMALRRPVVHSDVGGAVEMIRPGHNGFLFPVGDTAALVEKLAILADRAACRRMGHNARAVVEALFSEKTMVDRYEQVLLSLCRVRLGAVEAVIH